MRVVGVFAFLAVLGLSYTAKAQSTTSTMNGANCDAYFAGDVPSFDHLPNGLQLKSTSSSNKYAVCPLVGVHFPTLVNLISMNVSVLDPEGETSCSVAGYDNWGSLIGTEVLFRQEHPSIPTRAQFYTDNALSFDAEHYSLICLLRPGERINLYTFLNTP